jgi:hypothetical protein
VPFSSWLRSNSEHYLLIAAQQGMAAKYGRPAPGRERGAKALFFRTLFVPIYRRLPWRFRSAVIRTIPGSHRRTWTPRDRHTRQPAI